MRDTPAGELRPMVGCSVGIRLGAALLRAPALPGTLAVPTVCLSEESQGHGRLERGLVVGPGPEGGRDLVVDRPPPPSRQFPASPAWGAGVSARTLL